LEKNKDLIYVDLPTQTLFWWPRKSPSCPARWRPSARIALLGIVHLQTFVKLCKAKTCRTFEHPLLMCWKMLKTCLFPKFICVQFLQSNDSQKKPLTCHCRRGFACLQFWKVINVFCQVGHNSAIFHIDVLGCVVCLLLSKWHCRGKQV